MLRNRSYILLFFWMLIILWMGGCGGGGSGIGKPADLNNEPITISLDNGGTIVFPQESISANKTPDVALSITPTLPSTIEAIGDTYHVSEIDTLYGLAEIHLPIPQGESTYDVQIVKVSENGLLTVLESSVASGEVTAKTDSFSSVATAHVKIDVSPIIQGPQFLPVGETARFQEVRFSEKDPDSLNIKWVVYGQGEIVSREGRDILVKATGEGRIDVAVTVTNPEYGYRGFASYSVSAQTLVSKKEADQTGGVADPMMILISGGPTSILFGESVTFTGKAINAASNVISWSWSTGSDTVLGDSCNGCGNPYTFPSIQYDQLGKHLFSVSAFDQNGDESESEVEVVVRPKETAVVVEGPEEIDFKRGLEVNYEAFLTNIDESAQCTRYSFNWTFYPEGKTREILAYNPQSSFSVSPGEPGTYLLDLSVYCSSGPYQDTAIASKKLSLVVKGDNDPLTISISTITSEVEVNAPVAIEARVRGGVTIISGVRGKYSAEVYWNDPDNTVSSYQVTPYSSEQGGFVNPQFTYKKDGEYPVVLRVTDATGNSSETSSVIKVGEGGVSDGNESFSASISIPGHSVSFNPNPVYTLAGEVQGGDHLFAIASNENALNPFGSSLQIILDTKQISGPGAYTIGLSHSAISEEITAGAATLTFVTDDIHHYGYTTPVILAAESGTITFSKYSTNKGDRITGTFNATLFGEYVTGKDEDGDDITEDLTGTVSGRFDLEVK